MSGSGHRRRTATAVFADEEDELGGRTPPLPTIYSNDERPESGWETSSPLSAVPTAQQVAATASETDASASLTSVLQQLSSQLAVRREYTGVTVRDHNDINEFNPSQDEVRDWISKINKLSIIYGWDDAYICHLAINKLRGPAEMWYKTLTVVPRTWTEWTELLTKTFPSTRDLHTLMVDMLAYVPRPKEDLFEYCFNKLALVRKMNLNLSGPDEVNLIVGSIPNEHIKFSVKAANIDDPAKLAVYLKSFESVRTGPFPAKLPSSGNDTVAPPVKKIRQNTNPLNKTLLCFQCDKPGHKRAECPQRRVSLDTSSTPGASQAPTTLSCRYCRKPGHLMQNCFKRKRAHEASGQTDRGAPILKKQTFLVSAGSNENKFYKSITINKTHTLCAYVDFGSECSLITHSQARLLMLPIKVLPVPIKLTVFGGAELLVTEKTNCSILVDSVESEIELLVVASCIPGVDLVIGQNFTENTDIKYQRVGNILQFSYELPENALMNSRPQPINVSKEIPPEICKKLESVLTDYSSCFDDRHVGTIPGVEMSITLTSNQPIVRRPYRLAESEKQELRQLIEALLAEGTIRPSSSPYSSPVLMVKKRSGEKRLCVDYRALNKITVKDSYPLPIIEELVDRLSGYEYLTVLDFRAGYHQIKMAADSIPFTAFITPEGKYEYVKVPFGLASSPFVFQRTVNEILGTLRFDKVLVYLDDVLIPSKTMEEGIQLLQKVLNLFQKHNVTLNLSKCRFLEKEVDYLGYTIKNGVISPSETKVQAIKNFPTPASVHQIRQFLGLVGHFRKFVPDFSAKSRPLTNLLKKEAVWSWEEKEEAAFQTLKNYLVTKPILALFESSRPTILYTDASRLGIAGMLVQIVDGREVAIGYHSKHTTSAEQRYHSFELETLAIVSSVKRFRYYLVGIHFKIFTDCSAVRNAMTKKDPNQRIGRWVLELQAYNFDICHRPGSQMAHVDGLSRNPPNNKESITQVSAMILAEDDWLLVVQELDPNILAIKNILVSGDRQRHKAVFHDYEHKKGKVYRRTDSGSRGLVPKACRWQLLRFNHDDIGHFSEEKTYERLASKFWFPRMREFVKKYVKCCINCMYHKIPAGRKPGYLHPIPKVPRPFHTIHVDHLGPFCKSTKGNTQLLVFVDAYTKFCFLKAVKNTKARYVVQELSEIVRNFGVPRRIICDQGRAFASNCFKSYCSERNMVVHFHAVGMPRGNGQVERFHRTITESLAAMGANQEDSTWDENVCNIQLGLNNTLHKSLGVTPSEVLLGYRSGPDNHANLDDEGEAPVDVTNIRKQIAKKCVQAQATQKENFDAHRGVPKEYQVGDLVLVKISSIAGHGTSRKLLPKWKGPFRVTAVLANDRYQVSEIPGAVRSRIPYTGVYAAEHIKKWIVFGDPQVWGGE